jgi:hypothetical protein
MEPALTFLNGKGITSLGTVNLFLLPVEEGTSAWIAL